MLQIPYDLVPDIQNIINVCQYAKTHRDSLTAYGLLELQATLTPKLHATMKKVHEGGRSCGPAPPVIADLLMPNLLVLQVQPMNANTAWHNKFMDYYNMACSATDIQREALEAKLELIATTMETLVRQSLVVVIQILTCLDCNY